MLIVTDKDRRKSELQRTTTNFYVVSLESSEDLLMPSVLLGHFKAMISTSSRQIHSKLVSIQLRYRMEDFWALNSSVLIGAINTASTSRQQQNIRPDKVRSRESHVLHASFNLATNKNRGFNLKSTRQRPKSTFEAGCCLTPIDDA